LSRICDGSIGRKERNSDAPISRVQCDGVVDAVAEEGDVGTPSAGELDDARLLVWADPGEHGGVRNHGGERVVIESLELGAGEDRLDVKSDVTADLASHGAVVAGDDLDGDVEPVELDD
jgi:hypothetical protein